MSPAGHLVKAERCNRLTVQTHAGSSPLLWVRFLFSPSLFLSSFSFLERVKTSQYRSFLQCGRGQAQPMLFNSRAVHYPSELFPQTFQGFFLKVLLLPTHLPSSIPQFSSANGTQLRWSSSLVPPLPSNFYQVLWDVLGEGGRDGEWGTWSSRW